MRNERKLPLPRNYPTSKLPVNFIVPGFSQKRMVKLGKTHNNKVTATLKLGKTRLKLAITRLKLGKTQNKKNTRNIGIFNFIVMFIMSFTHTPYAKKFLSVYWA
jgi:hypothetical protein